MVNMVSILTGKKMTFHDGETSIKDDNLMTISIKN